MDEIKHINFLKILQNSWFGGYDEWSVPDTEIFHVKISDAKKLNII